MIGPRNLLDNTYREEFYNFMDAPHFSLCPNNNDYANKIDPTPILRSKCFLISMPILLLIVTLKESRTVPFFFGQFYEKGRWDQALVNRSELSRVKG